MKQFLYELLYLIGLVLYLPKGFLKGRLPHRGWRMRLGSYSSDVRERLRGEDPLWVHAVSVGEAVAAQPLLRGLRYAYPQRPLVLSAVTSSGFSIAARAVKESGTTVYFPLDLRVCVRRALSAIHPRALLLMESELWPTVIHETQSRGIPIAVINGRISERAFGRYRMVRGWVRPMVRAVNLFLMQSREDADRIIALGARPETVRVVGNLKWEASFGARPDSATLRSAAEQIGLRGSESIIVAGSTHRGEEEALLRAYKCLNKNGALRLILAPRHLERLDEVEGLIQQSGFRCGRFSDPALDKTWQVGLVDTFGHLPTYYGLASVVFIGGSLIPHGGQNPLEAASLGKPLAFGTSMYNFPVIAHQLLAHHAARQLGSDQELVSVFRELLKDRKTADAMGQRALELVESRKGATQRILKALKPLIEQGPSR